MIEFHEPPSDIENTGLDPYITPVDDVSQRFMDDNSRIIALLERMANYSDRQREKAAPEIIDLSPSVGLQVANTYSTKTRLRLMGLLITVSAADKYSFKIGSRSWTLYISPATPFITFPIEVAVGYDMSITNLSNPSAINWSALVFGYPE